MSTNNIPFDLQVEIIKKVLPVKSLIRFRLVSKQWKSLIDSSRFIIHHSVNQTQPHHLLVSYKVDNEDTYVSIVDDDNFPHHKFSPTIPPTVKQLSWVLMGSYSQGLVCLYVVAGDIYKIVIWNPSIRKTVDVMFPDGIYIFGFGVCPKTNDPKIVKITCSLSDNLTSTTNDFTLTSAEVFTLTSGVWRSISMNLPHKLGSFLAYSVVIDGVIYWMVLDNITKNNQIISFDLTSEQFGEVDLPNSLACHKLLYISKLNESLVVLDYYRGDAMKLVCDVWMMLKNGVSKPPSFTKLIHVKLNPWSRIIGFRNNGQPIMERDHSPGDSSVINLEVYEPSSEQTNGLGIYSSMSSRFRMSSYRESLLLLNYSL